MNQTKISSKIDKDDFPSRGVQAKIMTKKKKLPLRNVFFFFFLFFFSMWKSMLRMGVAVFVSVAITFILRTKCYKSPWSVL